MWWDVCEYERWVRRWKEYAQSWGRCFNFVPIFYSIICEVKPVKVCWLFFSLSTHQSPQQNVLVVGHDQDDVARLHARSRTPDATGEQRWQQHCHGCGGSSLPACGSSGSHILDCHWVTSAPPVTHRQIQTHTHASTQLFGCVWPQWRKCCRTLDTHAEFEEVKLIIWSESRRSDGSEHRVQISFT